MQPLDVEFPSCGTTIRAHLYLPAGPGPHPFSLGGTVAFFVPMHYPDVFSATSPFCGYPNLLGFQNVMGVKRAPWEDAMLAKRYIVNYAENGSYVPVHVVHGGLDYRVPDTQGIAAFTALQRRGIPSRFLYEMTGQAENFPPQKEVNEAKPKKPAAGKRTRRAARR